MAAGKYPARVDTPLPAPKEKRALTQMNTTGYKKRKVDGTSAANTAQSEHTEAVNGSSLQQPVLITDSSDDENYEDGEYDNLFLPSGGTIEQPVLFTYSSDDDESEDDDSDDDEVSAVSPFVVQQTELLPDYDDDVEDEENDELLELHAGGGFDRMLNDLRAAEYKFRAIDVGVYENNTGKEDGVTRGRAKRLRDRITHIVSTLVRLTKENGWPWSTEYAATEGFARFLTRVNVEWAIGMICESIPKYVQRVLGKEQFSAMDLVMLPRTEDTRLCQKGVYTDIVCSPDEFGIYVGSGSGERGIFQRWLDYDAAKSTGRSGESYRAHLKMGLSKDNEMCLRALAFFPPNRASIYNLLTETVLMIYLGALKDYGCRGSRFVKPQIFEWLPLVTPPDLKPVGRGLNMTWPLKQGFGKRAIQYEEICANENCRATQSCQWLSVDGELYSRVHCINCYKYARKHNGAPRPKKLCDITNDPVRKALLAQKKAEKEAAMTEEQKTEAAARRSKRWKNAEQKAARKARIAEEKKQADGQRVARAQDKAKKKADDRSPAKKEADDQRAAKKKEADDQRAAKKKTADDKKAAQAEKDTAEYEARVEELRLAEEKRIAIVAAKKRKNKLKADLQQAERTNDPRVPEIRAELILFEQHQKEQARAELAQLGLKLK